MHPEHLRELAHERRGRLLARAEQQRLISRAAPRPPLVRRGTGLFPAVRALFSRTRKASHILERAILDERPMAPVVPLWMWREHSAQTRFIGPGLPMTRPDRV
jgi:hypothetical protein